MIDTYCLAVNGVGFGSLAMATLGFWGIEVEVEIGQQPGWYGGEYEEPRRKQVVIRFSVKYKGLEVKKTYRVDSVITAKVLSKLLSIRRKRRSEVHVEVSQI